MRIALDGREDDNSQRTKKQNKKDPPINKQPGKMGSLLYQEDEKDRRLEKRKRQNSADRCVNVGVTMGKVGDEREKM